MHGYSGNILHVNLTTQELSVETPSEAFYRTYVGGGLLGLYYLWKFTPQGADPLGEDNTLVFSVGPATGLPVSGQSRSSVTFKSPSSGGVGDSQAGGFWPAELKFAGFDAVVVRGRSAAPIYLYIKDGAFELRDASGLWGKTTFEVDTLLKEELDDDKIEIAQIGPAGEKLANFAAIMNMSNRAWGRTGAGAVMGSKNLKAVVVRGSGRPQAANPEGVQAFSRLGASELKTNEGIQGLGKYGTIGVVMPQYGDGGLPTNNWDSGVTSTLAEAESISGERLYDELLRGADDGTQDRKGRDTCYACIIRCKRVVEGEWQGEALKPEYGGPEYETAAALGSYCGVSDMHAMSMANQLCNEYGVDTVSCGATLSWAMECFEHGVLTLEDTGGLPLKFGDADGMIKALRMTLNREGFGDVLAMGSAKAADKLGKGHAYLLTVKGQEMPAHMPQVKRSLGLIYAVNPFGADHQSSDHDVGYTPEAYEGARRFYEPIGLTSPQPADSLNEDKVAFAAVTQKVVNATDAISICQFVYGPSWQLYGPQHMAQLMSAVTGWDIGVDEILAIGERRVNLMRAFNAREGLGRESDYLPKKLLTKALKGGPSDGVIIPEEELETGMDHYFEMVGWNKVSGIPTRTTLEKNQLGWTADDLGL